MHPFATRTAALAAVALIAACTDLGPTAPSLDAPEVLRSDLTTEAFDGSIRIGVVPSATEITLAAAGDFTLTNRETGAVLRTGSGGEILVELETAGSVDTRRWLQTACVGETARDQWLAQAQALGYETHTQLVGWASCWKLLLGTLNQGWGDRVAFKNQAIADGLAGSDAWWPLITIVTEEPQVRVSHGGWAHMANGPVVLTTPDDRVTIDGSPYRGTAEVWTNGSGTLAGINQLPLEEYLYGVVPRELPPGPYGLPEAQKAQAVTARTYALANLGKRSSDGYDLLPTTSDQVYSGLSVEHPVSSAAVDATRGVVAVADGELITTLYHSTSGGWTANSEDVYTSAVSYLRGVPDAERGRATENVPTLDVFMRHANPTNLRAHAAGDFEADWSRYHRWVVEWTVDEMAEVLSASFGRSVTEVHAVEVTDRADQGRVREIVFETDAGTLSETKDRIRWALRYIDANGNHASLRSTLFFIEPAVERPSGQVIGWKAYGGGWGHGVGMSQTGAVGMAQRGRSMEEILAHYYQGSSLEQRW